MTFQQKLDAIVQKNNSLVCVGLDSDLSKLPEKFKTAEHPQFEFNKAIIDATHDLVCSYKPNSAFYEARGDKGIAELKMTFDYLTQTYPEIITILDAKRADIGNTNNGYVTFAFDYLKTDAITLHPYLGSGAITPFLQREDKGIIILCRTSNPGAEELQDLRVAGGDPVYKIVAQKVATEWNVNGNCLLVMGATYPEELREIRSLAKDMTFLVPGVGVQGGDVEATVRAGINSKKAGMIINSSRGIIFASAGEDFAQKAREETQKLKDQINIFRQ